MKLRKTLLYHLYDSNNYQKDLFFYNKIILFLNKKNSNLFLFQFLPENIYFFFLMNKIISLFSPKKLNRFPTFEKDSHEYQSRINKKFQQQQQVQNMGNNQQSNQMANNINMQPNRNNLQGLKHINAPFNNLEKGSNIFVTSNFKQKEEDSLHILKLGGLIANSEKANNESKSEVTLLQHKRLPEQIPAEPAASGVKKPKIE